MYNVDQWKIFEKLANSLPKRESMKVGALKAACFKSAPNDRVVRNAVRKPVAEGHIEIADRGEYRLTAKGVGFYQKMKKEGFKPSGVRQMAKPAQPIKKSAKKNKIKAAAKPVKKPAKKPAPKKAAKPAKKAAKAKKVETKPAEGSTPPAAPKKSSFKIPRPKKDAPAADDANPPPAALTF